ncbi:pilus assembly protein TadG-related protein, partial [Silvimonas sp.]|uniref:TadE/TadG family type IV pilus assembly protein n=1 Tax=Silvimonas sp. TaxID=2650811 RepID=UPI00284CA2A8
MAAIMIHEAKDLLGALARRLIRARGGNLAPIMAISLPVLLFAVGFGIDFSRAENAQTQLNAIADAAALAAVDPSMVYQSDSVAAAAATATFTSQAANVA